MIIYLDESGDLGFDRIKAGTSKTFVITLLVCDELETAHGFKTAVRRTLKNKINRKKGVSSARELKGSETILGVKTYFYRQLPQTGWRIYSVVLDKPRLLATLGRLPEKRKIYNFLARMILEKLPLSTVTSEAVTLVVDRSKGKDGIQEFNEYVTTHLEGLLPLRVSLNIYHENSHDNPGLQTVDSFSWGIFKKYEAGDSEWYRIFREKIEGEYDYPEKDEKKDGPYCADVPHA